MKKNYFVAILLWLSIWGVSLQAQSTTPQQAWYYAQKINQQVTYGNENKLMLLDKVEQRYPSMKIAQSESKYFYSDDKYKTLDSIWTSEINSDQTGHIFSERSFYRYDSNQRLVERVSTRWFIASKSWVNNSRYTYEYDGNGNIQTVSGYLWGEAQRWEKNYQYSYSYNNKNNIATIMTAYHKRDADEWQDLHTEIYRYDASGQLIQRVKKAVEFYGGAFVSKIEYTYNDKQQVASSIFQEYKNNAWAMRDQYTFAYDEQGNCIERIRNGYYNGTWQPAFRFTFEYDYTHTNEQVFVSDGIIELLGDVVENTKNPLLTQQAYSKGRHGWNKGGTTTLTYKKNVTNGLFDPIVSHEFALYPNPATDFLTIDTKTAPIGDNSIIRLFDSQGKLALQQTFQSGSAIDIASLPKGNFLFVITPTNTSQKAIGGQFIKK